MRMDRRNPMPRALEEVQDGGRWGQGAGHGRRVGEGLRSVPLVRSEGGVADAGGRAAGEKARPGAGTCRRV